MHTNALLQKARSLKTSRIASQYFVTHKQFIMKLLQKIGKALVNLSIKHLGVKPYDTDLLPLPKYPIVSPTIVYPVQLCSLIDIDVRRQQLTETYILEQLAKDIASSVDFQKCIKIEKKQISPFKMTYSAEIAIMPIEYLDTIKIN